MQVILCRGAAPTGSDPAPLEKDYSLYPIFVLAQLTVNVPSRNFRLGVLGQTVAPRTNELYTVIHKNRMITRIKLQYALRNAETVKSF